MCNAVTFKSRFNVKLTKNPVNYNQYKNYFDSASKYKWILPPTSACCVAVERRYEDLGNGRFGVEMYIRVYFFLNSDQLLLSCEGYITQQEYSHMLETKILNVRRFYG